MIIIQNTLVSEDLFEEHFVCDLASCKGVCCVEGDSGAPIESDEIPILEQEWEKAKTYMVPEGIEAIERDGLYQVDEDGDLRGTVVNFKQFYLYKNEARIDDGIPFTYAELETLPWTKLSYPHSI